MSGIVVGYALLLAPEASSVFALFPEWDTGLVAMLANATTVVLVTLATSAVQKREYAAA